jgi:hypothetical protein
MSRVIVLLMACVLIVQPEFAAAAPPADLPTIVKAADVALQQGGTFSGQVLDQQGSPLANAALVLTSGKEKWQTQTDREGRFRLSGLHGSVCQIHVGNQAHLVRLWAPGAAPPIARDELLLVDQPIDLIRGQTMADPGFAQTVGRWKRGLANPLIFTGIVATSIAVPVAVFNANQDEDAPASP